MMHHLTLLRYDSCITRRSHSFTCHLHTNHTCLYSPAARHHRPLAGTHVCLCQSFKATCKDTSAKLALPAAKRCCFSGLYGATQILIDVTLWATTRKHADSPNCHLTQTSVKQNFWSSWWYNKVCSWYWFQVHTSHSKSKAYCFCKLLDKPTTGCRQKTIAFLCEVVVSRAIFKHCSVNIVLYKMCVIILLIQEWRAKTQSKIVCFPVSNKTGEWQTTLHR